MSIISIPNVDRIVRPASGPALERLDRILARPLFFLAVAALVLAAGLIHRLSHGYLTPFEANVILWGLALLWPVFILEGLLRLAVCRSETPWWRRLGLFL